MARYIIALLVLSCQLFENGDSLPVMSRKQRILLITQERDNVFTHNKDIIIVQK